jgi:hypothetical protein
MKQNLLEGREMPRGKTVSIDSLFRAAGVESKPTTIVETPGVYTYKNI